MALSGLRWGIWVGRVLSAEAGEFGFKLGAGKALGFGASFSFKSCQAFGFGTGFGFQPSLMFGFFG